MKASSRSDDLALHSLEFFFQDLLGLAGEAGVGNGTKDEVFLLIAGG